MLLAFTVSLVVTPWMIRFSNQRKLFDIPERRKVHKMPIPRLGGVGVYLGTWLSWGVFCLFFSNMVPVEATKPLWGLFIGSTLIWVLGLYDDLFGANARKKLFVQVIAALIVVFSGVDIRILYSPIAGGDLFLQDSLTIWTLSVAWIVVVTNAINLIDGLDGLAGGVCMITALTIHFISRDLGIPHLPFFSLCLAGACLGFLIFNYSPARIFLGDSGSLFLGFVLACLSIMGTVKRSTAIVMFGPPIVLALPMVDTLLAIGRRFIKTAATQGDLSGYWNFLRPSALFKRVKEIFVADQNHIHHGLLKIGLSHRKAVLILYLVTAILGITAYRIAVYDYLLSAAITLGVLGIVLVVFLRAVRKKNNPK